MPALTNKNIAIFVLIGMVVMTYLVMNMQVKKEVAEAILEQYQKGNIPKEAYKKAVSDNKLTNWEAINLRK